MSLNVKKFALDNDNGSCTERVRIYWAALKEHPNQHIIRVRTFYELERKQASRKQHK